MHGMGLHPGSPALLQAPNFMMFSGELTPLPQRRSWKCHPCGMVSFQKDVFPSHVQIPKVHGGELLGCFLFESDFAKETRVQLVQPSETETDCSLKVPQGNRTLKQKTRQRAEPSNINRLALYIIGKLIGF